MGLRKLHTALIAIIAVVYVFSAKGYLEILDTQYSVETAISLVDRGSLTIPKEGETHRAPDGKFYSRYGVGLPISFVPYVAAGTVLSRVTHLPRMEMIGFLISFSNIPYALATLFLFQRLLRKLEISVRTTGFLTVALGLGTLCWRYAGYDYSEEIQMALLMLAVQGVVRPKGYDLVWAGIGGGGLIMLKLIYVVTIPVFGLYLLLQLRGAARWRGILQFGVPFAGGMFFIGWMNYIRYQNPFDSGYGHEAQAWDFGQMGQTIPALLVSAQIGVLVFCPVLLLGLAGWFWFGRKHPLEALLCAGLILENLFWTGAWHGWDGGWTWGPRLLVPMLPLWLLPAAFLIEAPKAKTWFPAFVALLAISVVAQVPGILVKDQEIHHIRNDVLTAGEAAGMPGDAVAAWMLLGHKLAHGDEVFPAASLTSQPESPSKVINLSSFQTFHGMNVWTEQTSRQMNKPVLRWLPLLGLIAIGGILVLARRLPARRRE